ncbi:MAG: hypothetical protein IPH54_17870 [Rhodoferax sp.]|nr:hypothetical protein [Rhodoferax sp.]
MSTGQCERLRAAFGTGQKAAGSRAGLDGGRTFGQTVFHLNVIEAASLADGSAVDESAQHQCHERSGARIDWHRAANHGGSAGWHVVGGRVFLARAADLVDARDGHLEPALQNMGNLYGSEY